MQKEVWMATLPEERQQKGSELIHPSKYVTNILCRAQHGNNALMDTMSVMTLFMQW
jgi:Zn-dependent oligopeptidase